MANIRTLADLQKEDEERAESQPIFGNEGSLLRRQNDKNLPVYYSSSNDASPRGLPIQFLDIIFPHITWKSIFLLIVIAQWVVYIICLCLGSELPLIPSAAILRKFGANIPPLIVKGQIWRLICPVFLHANFVHIFFNTFFQMRIAFTIERKYGMVLFTVLYFISAIIGNAFSASIFFCELKVGASTAGFGMIGLQMAEILLSWHTMRHRERVLANVMIYIIIMTLFIFTFSGDSIDQMGHLGGFIAGMTLGYLFNWNMEYKPHWYSIGQYLSIFILLCISVTSFSLLFFLHRTCNVV